MKVCSKCLQNKPFEEFFVRDKATGRLHAQCKGCYKQHRTLYYAEHYAKYAGEYKKRAQIRRTTTRDNLHFKMLNYLKNKACVVCGENDIRTLEFDHIDPNNKSFGIAAAIRYGHKWNVILEEIEKCRILCANCHKKHTAMQKNWYKLIE